MRYRFLFCLSCAVRTLRAYSYLSLELSQSLPPKPPSRQRGRRSFAVRGVARCGRNPFLNLSSFSKTFPNFFPILSATPLIFANLGKFRQLSAKKGNGFSAVPHIPFLTLSRVVVPQIFRARLVEFVRVHEVRNRSSLVMYHRMTIRTQSNQIHGVSYPAKTSMAVMMYLQFPRVTA